MKFIKRHLGEQHTGMIGMAWDTLLENLDIVEPDYALIKLDRKVTGRNPLPIERTFKLNEGDKIFTIGHPSGLPVKIAGGAKIRDNSPENFYLTDLDTFGGNSGSAVFSQKTGRIIGILVRGGADFVDDSEKGCRKQKRVSQDYGKGEAVNRLDPLLSSIPEIGVKKPAEAKQPATVPSQKVSQVKSPDASTRVKPNVKITNPF